MRKISIAALGLLLIVTACNNNKDNQNAGKTETDTVAQHGAAKPDAAAEMDKQKEELEKLTPVALDALKGMLPETFMGGSRTSIDANANNGASLATAEYAINDSMQVLVNIFDCAGPGGAGIFSMQFQSLENSQQETEDEYTKSVTINNNKGYEHCDKVSKDCTITYFTGGRYLVVLEGKGVGAPALRAAAPELKVK